MATSAEPNPTQDPFAAERSPSDDPFASQRGDDAMGEIPSSPDSPTMPRDRRMSKEWDASKVPPSQFQKRKGSVYATPGSRDGHVDSGKTRDSSFHAKLKERGWK